MTRRTGLILVLSLLAAAYLCSGLTVIQPDEIGVVRRLGSLVAEHWEPGLHWGFPLGFDRVDRLKMNQTRTIAVGASGARDAPLSRAPDPAADEFMTADLNLVTAEALVQYRVREPAAFLFRARSVESSLRASSEWALTRALARRGIDELLTTGRAEVADRLRSSLQSLADEEGLGVSIVAVRLGRVTPPAAVAPAFADAARARSDRRQAITRAEEYRDRSGSDSRGAAREIADSAAGRYDRLVLPARGEAERFTRVSAEARKSPGAFRRRVFLETLAEILPRFRRKVIVPPNQTLDISLVGEEAPSRPESGIDRGETASRPATRAKPEETP